MRTDEDRRREPQPELDGAATNGSGRPGPLPRTSAGRTDRTFGVAAAIGRLLGGDPPIAVRCYDQSRVGPADADTTLVVRSPNALRYALTAPGELGIARAYVAGELDIEGDIFSALSLRDHMPAPRP